MVKMDTETISLLELLDYLETRAKDAIVLIYKNSTYQAGLLNIGGGWLTMAITSKLPSPLAQYVIYTREFNEHMLTRILQREWETAGLQNLKALEKNSQNGGDPSVTFLKRELNSMMSWTNAKIVLIPDKKLPEYLFNLTPIHLSDILGEAKRRIETEQMFRRYIQSDEDFLAVSPAAPRLLVKHPELTDLHWEIFLAVKTSHKRAKDLIREIAKDAGADEDTIKRCIVDLMKIGILEKKPTTIAKRKSPYSRSIIKRFIESLRRRFA